MGNTRFCSQCGEPLDGRFKFCPGCGTVITEAGSPEQPPPYQPRETALKNNEAPVSSEARRILEQFDARFQALEASRKNSKKPTIFNFQKSLGPKVRILLAASSVAFIIVFVFVMLLVFRYMSGFFKTLNVE
jgi:hypothetical protein